MNAIEFSNKYAGTVKNFFLRCVEYEPMTVNKAQDITLCFTTEGFSLRLETVKNAFSQDFNVSDEKITPLCFETH